MKLTPAQQREIEQRFRAGESYMAIVRETGIPYSTVRDFIQASGLKRPRPKSRSPWRTERFEQQRGPLLDRHQLRGGA